MTEDQSAAGSAGDTPVEPVETPEETEAAPAEPTVEEQLKERTDDLQRLAAEYKNYRARAEREREAARAR